MLPLKNITQILFGRRGFSTTTALFAKIRADTTNTKKSKSAVLAAAYQKKRMKEIIKRRREIRDRPKDERVVALVHTVYASKGTGRCVVGFGNSAVPSSLVSNEKTRNLAGGAPVRLCDAHRVIEDIWELRRFRRECALRDDLDAKYRRMREAMRLLEIVDPVRMAAAMERPMDERGDFVDQYSEAHVAETAEAAAKDQADGEEGTGEKKPLVVAPKKAPMAPHQEYFFPRLYRAPTLTLGKKPWVEIP